MARISERVPFAAKGWMLLSKRSFCVPRNVELYTELELYMVESIWLLALVSRGLLVMVVAVPEPSLAAIAKPRAERGLLV